VSPVVRVDVYRASRDERKYLIQLSRHPQVQIAACLVLLPLASGSLDVLDNGLSHQPRGYQLHAPTVHLGQQVLPM
jgi:hypothetical protein